jgi:hypothetical protein
MDQQMQCFHDSSCAHHRQNKNYCIKHHSQWLGTTNLPSCMFCQFQFAHTQRLCHWNRQALT